MFQLPPRFAFVRKRQTSPICLFILQSALNIVAGRYCRCLRQSQVFPGLIRIRLESLAVVAGDYNVIVRAVRPKRRLYQKLQPPTPNPSQKPLNLAPKPETLILTTHFDGQYGSHSSICKYSSNRCTCGIKHPLCICATWAVLLM
jgi:hypothetical protein